MMTLSLVRSTPDQSVLVFGQDTLLSWCVSPPRCINGYTSEFNAGDSPSHVGLVEVLHPVAALCYRNQDKLQPDWATWLVCRLYLTYIIVNQVVIHQIAF